MELSGWGRYPRFETMVFEPLSRSEAQYLQHDLSGFVPRGNGRAYGDAAIGRQSCLCMRGLDRFCSFDEASGRVSRGFSLPTS
jgi:decaprenylphospho-beta-D-ribofuranose 2-oxidase